MTGGDTRRPGNSRRSGKRGSDCRMPAPEVPENEGPGSHLGDGFKPPPSEYYGSMAAGSIVGANNGFRPQQKTQRQSRMPQGAQHPRDDGAHHQARGMGDGQNGRRAGRKGEGKDRSGNNERRGRAQLVRCHEGPVLMMDPSDPSVAAKPRWLALTVNCLTVFTSASKAAVELMIPHRQLRKASQGPAGPGIPPCVQVAYMTALPPGQRRPMPLPPDDLQTDLLVDVAAATAPLGLLTFSVGSGASAAAWLLSLRIALRYEIALSLDGGLSSRDGGAPRPSVPRQSDLASLGASLSASLGASLGVSLGVLPPGVPLLGGPVGPVGGEMRGAPHGHVGGALPSPTLPTRPLPLPTQLPTQLGVQLGSALGGGLGAPPMAPLAGAMGIGGKLPGHVGGHMGATLGVGAHGLPPPSLPPPSQQMPPPSQRLPPTLPLTPPSLAPSLAHGLHAPAAHALLHPSDTLLHSVMRASELGLAAPTPDLSLVALPLSADAVTLASAVAAVRLTGASPLPVMPLPGNSAPPVVPPPSITPALPMPAGMPPMHILPTVSTLPTESVVAAALPLDPLAAVGALLPSDGVWGSVLHDSAVDDEDVAEIEALAVAAAAAVVPELIDDTIGADVGGSFRRLA